MEITRRSFMKGLSLGTFALFTGSALSILTGCSNEEAKNEEKEECFENSKYCTPTGNTKEFEEETHVISTILTREDNNGGYYYNVEVPKGYRLVDTETIRGAANRYYVGTQFIFVNTVPVIADEYIDAISGEVCYPYAGTIKDLEKNKQLSKSL